VNIEVSNRVALTDLIFGIEHFEMSLLAMETKNCYFTEKKMSKTDGRTIDFPVEKEYNRNYNELFYRI
jgi:hypothetical protein